MLQEMAALLNAGRHGTGLWEDLLAVYGKTGTGFAGEVAGMCEAVLWTTAAGGRPSAAIRARAAAAATSRRTFPFPARSNRRRLAPGGSAASGWFELALCLEVSERSGAPLAGILTRFAVQADARLDMDQARQSALAGPKATLRLLGWLPVSGLLLGWLIGIDPWSALTGSTAGLMFLALGAAFMSAARYWSSRLVRAAAGPG